MGKVIYKILAQQLRAGKLLRRFVEGCFELRISVGSYPWAAGCRRTVKSPRQPVHRLYDVLMGFINTRRIATTRLMAIKIQLAYKITSAPPMLTLPSWIKKAVVSLQYHQHRRNGQIQCNDEKQVQHQQHCQIYGAHAVAQLVYKLCHITPSL